MTASIIIDRLECGVSSAQETARLQVTAMKENRLGKGSALGMGSVMVGVYGWIGRTGCITVYTHQYPEPAARGARATPGENGVVGIHISMAGWLENGGENLHRRGDGPKEIRAL
jgi:hypothetical protein